MISTRFSRLFGTTHPLVQAGMGGVACAELAAAVSKAGGLGMLGMIGMPPALIRDQIRRTRALTERPFGVNLVPAVMPGGRIDAELDACLEERVAVVSLFWCDPTPFVGRCHAAGARLMLQVGAVEEARGAAAAGVDAIIVQGIEAGGHVRGTVALTALLPAVRDAVGSLPVLASGGIADGRGLAAALALGADGAWVGTRFVASDESAAHSEYKRRLVEAPDGDATTHTTAFAVGWPDAPHRVLRNALTEGAPPPDGTVARVRFGELVVDVPAFSTIPPTIHTEGRTDLMANYAGQGVGLIHEVLPAAAIVERIVAEAEALIGVRLRALLG
jgi:nitronate monooxygenase